MKKPLQTTLKVPPHQNNEDNIPWNNTKNTYQALHTKKDPNLQGQNKAGTDGEETILIYPICTEEGTGRKKFAGAGSEWRRSGCGLKSLVLLFGYGKELVWSIFPCWLEYRARGILVRDSHKVEREIAQDLKMQVWVNWVYRIYSSPSKCKSVNAHWPLYWA